MMMEFDVRDFLRKIESEICSRRITFTYLQSILGREIKEVSQYKALALAEADSIRYPRIDRVESYLQKLRELRMKLKTPECLSAQATLVPSVEERDINRLLLRILNRTTRN